jgi:pyruvate/2-oxoglutarate dehydrogenase complex dihydrolipoamide acyltransferase (E2) component
VTRQDVLAYLARRREGPAAEDEIVPFTPMRRAIAEHMVRSTHTAAHATAIIEVDMTAIAEYREREKAAFAEPLTYLPFIIQATAKALRGHPRLNAWVYEDRIVLKREIAVGLAVGLQDGLIVPVLRGVDGLGLGEIARRADDVARRARDKRLTPQEVQGGTFTVNNFGVSGILLATPIIVQPQAAILGIGAVTRRPAVAGSEVAVRALVYLCLSFDHRVIDGAVAGGFLQALRTALEGFDPAQE